MSILLKNGTVLTVNENMDVLENVNVYIEDNKIKYIGKEEKKAKKVINCKNKLIMPGLINCHTHTPMTMFRNFADDLDLHEWLTKEIFPREKKFKGERIYYSSILAMIEMIKSGTTTFNDMYFEMEQVIKACEKMKMRATLCDGLTINNNEYDNYFYETINNIHSEKIKYMTGIHSMYTTEAGYIKEVLNLKRDKKNKIHIHIAETKKEFDESLKKYDKTPVEYLNDLGVLDGDVIAAHLVHTTENDRKILKEKNANVVYNPVSNMKLSSGIAKIQDMLDRGINVCIGTDGASSNNDLDLFKEIKIGSYLQKVGTGNPKALKAEEAIKMITKNGAHALGYDNLGSIEEGNLADLIIIDLNNSNYYPQYDIKHTLIYSLNSRDVETVIIDGEIIMENKEIKVIDENEIYKKIENIKEKN